jgi:hypothetical protein
MAPGPRNCGHLDSPETAPPRLTASRTIHIGFTHTMREGFTSPGLTVETRFLFISINAVPAKDLLPGGDDT